MDCEKHLYELIDQKTNELKQLLASGSESLQKEQRKLEEDRKKYEEITKKIQDFHLPDKIVLDVGNFNTFEMYLTRITDQLGGTRYATSVNNLTKIKGSFFSSMFSGTWSLKPGPDGSYFIDR